jgi:hypothetical protein
MFELRKAREFGDEKRIAELRVSIGIARRHVRAKDTFPILPVPTKRRGGKAAA